MDSSAAQLITGREAGQSVNDRVARRKPRLGFLGVGWIGRRRMEAVANSGLVEVAAIADTSSEMAEAAAAVAPGAELKGSLEALLDAGVDGVVIATPSALHAEQSIVALERGVSVFCQKPLGRSAAETRRVVEAARRADRLLGVDLCYRHLAGAPKIRDLIRGGELGRVYAIDLVFHNAYGPDKDWFYDRRLSGGGCVMDLGIHLVDLALWALDFPRVENASSRLFAGGEPLGELNRVEDYAAALLTLSGGAVAQMACSWRLPAGCDAVISASFYGTLGGAAMRNVGGSFYDFIIERFHGTRCETLAGASDGETGDWSGRAIVEWARGVAAGGGFDPAAERLADVASALDAIYANRWR
ncbi:MAG: Inositol 2-dehydrogenase/D-chiro-inositol 3-dehydrogenase [Acidobacteria bacterium]|nr:Inositol 2-dehydrogenase/D-chiro-inositol 3-dehydrogenase [Acidobacteriota bacterium]